MTQRDLFGGGDGGGFGAVEEKGKGKGKPRVREADRDQLTLEVVDLDTLLAEDHPARTLWAAVEQLDLRLFYEPIASREGHAGRPATDPKLLVCLWLYATSDGVSSARHLDELCRCHAAYRWICGGVSVNPATLASFRVGHEKALDDLMTQVLGKLMAAGLVKLERVAHDGMRVRASAGAKSFRRRTRLEQCLDEAHRHIEQLKAQANPAGERTRREAAQLRGAEDRLRRVQEALAKMPEAEATKARRKGSKEPRVSTTDPDARVMKMADGGFRPAYNLQLSTDTQSRFIVGAEVSTQGSDAKLAPRAIDDIGRRSGRSPNELLVDGGYVSLASITEVERRGVTVYAPPPAPRSASIDPHARKPEDTDESARWRARMATDEAKAIYKERASTAETTNGDLRRHRGIDLLPVRGIAKVTSCLLWGALTYNLLRAPLEALMTA